MIFRLLSLPSYLSPKFRLKSASNSASSPNFWVIFQWMVCQPTIKKSRFFPQLVAIKAKGRTILLPSAPLHVYVCILQTSHLCRLYLQSTGLGSQVFPKSSVFFLMSRVGIPVPIGLPKLLSTFKLLVSLLVKQKYHERFIYNQGDEILK